MRRSGFISTTPEYLDRYGNPIECNAIKQYICTSTYSTSSYRNTFIPAIDNLYSEILRERERDLVGARERDRERRLAPDPAL